MKLKSFFILVWLCPALAYGLTLEEVTGAAVASHPAIAQRRESTARINSMRQRELWPENPRVGVMFEQSPAGDFGLGNADMTDYSVLQEVPNPLSLRYRSQKFRHEIKAAEHMTTSEEREVIFRAKKAFFELVASRNALAAKRRLISYYDQIISSLDKSYQADTPTSDLGTGMSLRTVAATLGDVLMARMKRAEVEAEVFELNYAVKKLSAQINLLMGRSVETRIGNLVMPREKRLKISNTELVGKLAASNSDLKAYKEMERGAQTGVSLARSDLLPGVMTEMRYNQRRDMENAYTVGFSLSVPLWISKNSAVISEAKANSLEKSHRKESVELELKSELFELAEFARENFKILNVYRNEILPLAESAVSTAMADHQSSRTSAISVLQKIVSFHEAVGMYWELWAEYHIEFAMLENMIGEDL